MKIIILIVLALSIQLCQSQLDFIRNGKFQETDCSFINCIFYNYNYRNQVRGWLPDPEIQIGYGHLYSNYLGSEKVVELDANRNTCIRQIINDLPIGTYSAKFKFATNKYVQPSESQFGVFFRGRLQSSHQAWVHGIHEGSSLFFNTARGDAEIRFCGMGPSNGFGALLLEVKLFRY